MTEIYIGTKFKTIIVHPHIEANPELSELIKWCRIFHDHNFTPPYPGGSSGNLSFRINPGDEPFIITASHTSLGKKLNSNDFVEIIACNYKTTEIHTKGLKEPSSETFMHDLIYKSRPEINAIFHGHSDEIMKLAKQKGFPETDKELAYGTIELAKDAAITLKNHNFVILKNHGFISVGKTQNEAGNRILNL